MKVNNQKPAFLSPIYDAVIKGDYKPIEYMKQTMIKPLLSPLVANQPVTIEENGKILNDDDLCDILLSCMGDQLDPNSEAIAKEMFGHTLTYFDTKTNLSIQDTYTIQAAKKENLPFPTKNIIYTPAIDVIPSCKEFLAGACSYEKMFTSLSLYARPETLGFYFANEKSYEDFKIWLKNEINNISNLLSIDVKQMFDEFQKIKLDGLTESFILRDNDDDGNEEFSFARTLIAYLMLYTKSNSPALYGIFPFNVGELFCPKTIVFVNIEKHARSSAKKIADEWKIINKSMQMKPKIANMKKLKRLTETARALSKIQANVAMAIAHNGNMGLAKSANIRFKKSAPTHLDIAKRIMNVLNKMANTNKSENIYKTTKMTYNRPNRRNPDDFNKQGKMISTKYKPNIHLYIDTSGSISEKNYQDEVKACINMAKKLNINLYFNSFSHILSQCAHLKTKDKSKKQIYKEFQKLPKVTGGTNYEQIWHYINNSKKRKKELSIIMTDFEYLAPNHFVKHPKNLVYIPCSNMNWDYLSGCATNFCKSMMSIDPECRKKILC